MTQLATTNELNQIQNGLQSFEERKQKVSELAESTKELSLTDWKDKAALKDIATKRKEIKAERVAIQKEGKAMRDLITPVTKHIKAKEDELIAILEPEEERLQKMEDWAVSEAEKERLAEIEAENKRIQDRIDSLAKFGYQIDYSYIKSMSDETFGKYLEAAKVQHEKEQAEKAEQERIQAEQEEKQRQEQEAERLRIEAERKELDELRKQQEDAARIIREEQERLAAEKKKIEDERQAIEQKRIDEENAAKRAAEIKAAQEEASEKARLKAIEDAKEAERLKAEAEEKARIAAQRKAERAPDKVKIQKYIADVKSVAVPELKTKEAKEVMDKIQELISRFDTFATQQTESI